MNRLVGRAPHELGLEESAPVAGTGISWLSKSWPALLCVIAASAFAQDVPVPPPPTAVTFPEFEEPHPQTPLMTVIEPKYEQDPTSLSPLGDDFSPATGTVTFSATDISIPGNFAIPVALRRWVPSDDADTGGPAGWKWNIPFIRGNYLDVSPLTNSADWNWGNPEFIWRNGKNCTGSADTVIDSAGKLIAANAYWQGKLLHIPGVTSETFVTTSSGEQVTKSHFKISSCITNNASDQEGVVQQGIVVQGPDGTTYTFNQIKSYHNGKRSFQDPTVRTRLLMITSIKDRFNNEVIYSYDADGKLEGISASDGREIRIAYSQDGEVQTASAHGRTWTYNSSGVTLPDGRQWAYDGMAALAFDPNQSAGYNQKIQLEASPSIVPGCSVASGDYPVTIDSPDGLKTVYTFRDTIHYRADVEPDLYTNQGLQNYTLSRALYCTVKRSLISKVSSGPGVGTYTWTYTYSGNRGTYKETSIPLSKLTGPFNLLSPKGGYPAVIVAGGGAVNYRSVTIKGPDKRSVFYIDRRFQSISEERVVAQDTLDASGLQLLERREFSFGLGAVVGTHWYMCPCEGAYPPINEQQLTHHINQTQERRIQYVGNVVGATFTAESTFDSRGRPKTLLRTGNVSDRTRTERILYDEDNTIFGVMGQLKSISIDGIINPMVEHTYDSYTAQRTLTMKFGNVQAHYEYHADGNLWKQIDGRGHATAYTDYYRGQPQRIDRANGTFETVDINDWGLVTGRIDPNGNSWSYRYDEALRLEEVTPPPGWTHTSIGYERASDFDMTNVWRQTVDKGNSRIVTYFDVLWRPLMVRSYDIGNEANTRKVVVKTFDVGGQVVFESYPQRDLATVVVGSPGHRMQYDALGRNTRLEADSANGVLVTTTAYLTGFKTKVTNPRNQITTQGLWALDDPDEAQVATITAPEGVNVAITRNLLGNPISIRRWGSSANGAADVTRSYVYDPGQRLCKTLEPEVVATAQGYDLAGNVAWRSPGVNLTANICASEASIPPARKVSYTYDSVNQLSTVTYGDGSPGIARSYWNDGLLRTLQTLQPMESERALWNYEYNSLRKPATEELNYGGKKYNFVWAYDANGNLNALSYPTGGPNPIYSPNAMGEPTQVGSYATNIASHPNGAISDFTFGNNIVHSLTQTTEGTPHINTDGTVVKDSYSYDANGNVTQIEDLRSNPIDGNFTRTMKYDNLDRLTEGTGVWGTATYRYDPVDDLKRATVGTRDSIMSYGSITKRLDSVVTNGITTSYQYDGNGNITQKGAQTYAFDLGNRLGGNYAYDGHGRRTKITNSDGTTSIQVYSQGGQLLWSEKSAGGTIPATLSYICSTGTLVELQCVTTSTYPAMSMTCNAGDTLSDGMCIHTSSYDPTVSYSCPSGGSLDGIKCIGIETYSPIATYSCNAGDARDGTSCTRIVYESPTVTFTCPSGYTLRLTKCETASYSDAAVTYSCNGAGTLNASGLCIGMGVFEFTYYEAWDACLALADDYGLSLDSIEHVSGRIYNCVLQATPVYSCPDGGALNGTQCVSTITQDSTVVYNCTVGTLILTPPARCAVPQNYGAHLTYSCPRGSLGSDDMCRDTTNYPVEVDTSCPSGGSLSQGKCKQTSNYPPEGGGCNAGDDLDTCVCTHITTAGAAQTYTCPNGGTLSDLIKCVGANATATAYIYLGGKQIAETVVGGVTQYVHTDALGSPVAHTDQAGAVLNRTKYEPYGYTAAGTKPGAAIAGLTTTGSAIGFTGHVNDPETDLVYMQQRYYDPVAGRFLSVDPVVTDAGTGSSFNRYAYGNNNPYKYVDPDGRNPLLRSVYAVSYGVATRLGAARLGVAISSAIFVATHKPPMASSGQGCIYCVPGTHTSTGEKYVGSTDNLDQRKTDKSDGRDRNAADVIDTYNKDDREERRRKEQQAINDLGGVENLDNRRNEIRESKWDEKGVTPSEPSKPTKPKEPELPKQE